MSSRKILLLPFAAAVAAALLAAAPAAPQNIPTLKTPTRVSLSFAKVPLAQAFMQIEKQTGIRFSVPAGRANAPSVTTVPVSLTVKDRPLWETLQALLQQVGQGPVYEWTTLAHGKSVRSAGRICISGPFIVVASRIRETIDLHGPDPQHELIVLELQVLCDSATPMEFTAINDSLPTLSDDTGNHAAPKPPPASGPTLATSGQLQYAFSRTGEQGKKGRVLTSIDGTVSAGFVKSVQTFSVSAASDAPTDLAFRDLVLTVSTALATSRPPNADANTRAVVLKLPNALPDPSGEFQRLLAGATVSLAGSDGAAWRLIQNGGALPVGNGGGPSTGYTRQLLFSPPASSPAAASPGAASPGTITIKIPSEITTVDVPFHFENLPLP